MQQAESAVAKLKANNLSNISDTENFRVNDLEEEVVDLIDIEEDDEAPIIRLVNSLLSQAVKDRASDVHVEPFEKQQLVRFRVDGMLYEVIKSPRRFQKSIVSRIKVMAGLDIAEKRLPQDGRIRLKVAGKDFDIRVSTVPTRYGERIVMRLLDRSSILRNLEDIGFSYSNFETVEKLIKLSSGIILVTGPTGSGKTSTLYAFLAKINKSDLNILTIEDPIEYQLKGIGQVQVNNKIDLTFASGLRAFLRQDPDVIMVGEIRDKETAKIAIQASLTGHLVLATLHTNDASSSISRMLDMGIEPFLIASSLVSVLAQRLVRKIHINCRKSYSPTKEELYEIYLPLTVKKLWKGQGCKKCQGTGYSGRIAIYELFIINNSIRSLIMKSSNSSRLKSVARKLGMLTLREDGAAKVLEGVTTIEEVTRIIKVNEGE